MTALSCFQAKRRPVGFSVASSGNASGIAPPAAFSRYKDLHPSLFSHFLLHLSSTSACRPLAPFRIARVYATSPTPCCLTGLCRPSPIVVLWLLHEAFCWIAFPFGITLLHLSPTPSPDLLTFAYGRSQR